ncbi:MULTISPECIES: DUF6124 family protein [Pseudomonas syringae group]|uniref:DUF3077 domain-containing protein n=1 Tax=Pseudomonas syringae pv. ribicola TaxID=55398 RepID=A0A0P9ZP38_PSESI|nr:MULTISPECIES: hypothetical protein [Pseudomonas syringae group]MBD8568724.1 DUF3077 domain-containing protein [Pseudomonas syringae]EKN46336.1 hypothetical protein AAI_11974 [Pseudomonas viridiflava UASWS0038]KPL65241.1 hypothetical protein PVFL_07755 [Pseudomonas viridiflava]KPY49412.1 Uncharacterized protein ALO47_01356 [Pseudomonas syringae pv. ribicola]KPZ18417.1 Uncharacterized protein ALO56_04240 [Pseudomonas viridiflava]
MINSTPAPPHTSLEETLIQVSDILRCASAAAYESGDALNGAKRDLAFSVVHLIDIARTRLDRSLEDIATH